MSVGHIYINTHKRQKKHVRQDWPNYYILDWFHEISKAYQGLPTFHAKERGPPLLISEVRSNGWLRSFWEPLGIALEEVKK